MTLPPVYLADRETLDRVLAAVELAQVSPSSVDARVPVSLLADVTDDRQTLPRGWVALPVPLHAIAHAGACYLVRPGIPGVVVLAPASGGVVAHPDEPADLDPWGVGALWFASSHHVAGYVGNLSLYDGPDVVRPGLLVSILSASGTIVGRPIYRMATARASATGVRVSSPRRAALAS